jgi:hypothetical protein
MALMAQPNLGHDLERGLPLLDESLQRFLPHLYDIQLGSGSWEPLLHEIKEYLKARGCAHVTRFHPQPGLHS